MGANVMNGSMRSTMVDGTNERYQRAQMVGMKSKTSSTWLNGPTHEIRNQCVPGYTGFISGVKSENLFSQSYANSTAKSFKGKITRGANFAPDKRFCTLSQKKFNDKHFRRVQQSPDNVSKRDYLEYMMTLNAEHGGLNENKNTFQKRHGSVEKFTGTYLDTTNSTMSP